ncbi:hypothetical protein LTR12_000892 [Friedmanniomyces endolithicus]|nr:hypothetical protein LTR74_012385 [Friedmanniomyces endolithicus]KAK1824568.1 hypothetical protein LTR12_000892 [Friedmanniomyces endolithicus]
MEDGSRNGSIDHHDATTRRKTFSGPLRQSQENGDNAASGSDAMRFPWSPPSAPGSPTSSAPPVNTPAATAPVRPHRRTISGSILQRLNFLRPTSDNARPQSRDKEPTSPKSAKSRKSIDDDSAVISPTSPKRESAMSFALRPTKARKRKGSLRKTALLGGKRDMSASSERKSSGSAKSPLGNVPLKPLPLPPAALDDAIVTDLDVSDVLDATSASPSVKKQFSYEDSLGIAAGLDGALVEPPAVTAASLSLLTDHKVQQPADVSTNSSPNDLGSPLEMRSPTSYASTTSDDEILTFDRPVHQQSAISLPKPITSAATSYFPSTPSSTSLLKPISKHHPRSPLSHTVSSSPLYSPSPPAHDYTETAYWGWVILFATWLTFTVGMGSCLEIWSWAWDVGETPYAPPELEDDPTLPIVGYYPALMVLTGVVAWVWVVVAWVGMKYFRHAGIEV